MKAPTLLAAGCLAALLSACATGPSIRSDYDQKADFSRYRTFGYMSPLGTDKAGYSSLLTERLKDATRGQMEMRGYVYNTADPDLLINFNGKLQQKTQVTQAPPYRSLLRLSQRLLWRLARLWLGRHRLSIHGGYAEHRPGRRAPQAAGVGRRGRGRVRNPEMAASQQSVEKAVAQVFSKYPFRAGVAAPQGPDKSSLEESRMSTARPSRKRQAAPADTDSPRRTSKTAPADADSPGRAAADSGGAQSYDTVALVLQGGGAWGPTRPGCTRACTRPASAPTGWRAFPSVRSTPPSSPARPRTSAWRGCAGSGRRSAGRPASPPCLGAIRWPACSRAFRSASARRP